MRRSWMIILSLAMLMALATSGPAFAKKSRSKGASSTRVKRGAQRSQPRRALAQRTKGATSYAGRGRRGRRLARSRGRRRTDQPTSVIASGTTRPSPGIPTERVTEIQTALINAGYMDGPASGLYDDVTIEGMKQFQAKNGLSQTGLPSARLLKKLGVPKRSNDGYAVPVNSVSETDKKRPSSEQPQF